MSLILIFMITLEICFLCKVYSLDSSTKNNDNVNTSKIRSYHIFSPSDINMEVWVSVLRMSTKYLTIGHVNALSWFPLALQRYGGWYEGYSAGVPGLEITSHIEKGPYGCWHLAWPSNIYVNIGNFLSLTRNRTVANYANAYFNKRFHSNETDHGDKKYCSNALKLGYQSLLLHYPYVDNKKWHRYEIVLCDKQCSTVSFNNTCPPVSYYQLLRNNTFQSCTCNDNYDILNCNSDEFHKSESIISRVDYIHEHFKKEYYKKIELPPKHIYHNHKCILEYKSIEYLQENVENAFQNIDDFIIIFTTNMLDYPQSNYHSRLINRIRNYQNYNHSNNNNGHYNNNYKHNKNKPALILNLETDNIGYFNSSIDQIHNLNNKYNRRNYPKVFQNALAENYKLLTNYISPWENHFISDNKYYNDDDFSSSIYLYSNIDTIQNCNIFKINSVTVGIIMYNIELFKSLQIFTSASKLINWINAKAKCMRKSGVNIVVVVGNGDNRFSKNILAKSYRYVSLVLGLLKDAYSSNGKQILLPYLSPLGQQQLQQQQQPSSSNNISSNIGEQQHNEEKMTTFFYSRIHISFNNSQFSIVSSVVKL